MVHLETMQRQERFYQQHKREILESGHKFAVIYNDQINYFDTEKSLYRKHPYFRLGAEPVYGTLPKLVDIGMENNTLEYRRKQLEDSKRRFDEQLLKLLQNGDRLAEREVKLEDEVKRDASRTRARMAQRQYDSVLSRKV